MAENKFDELDRQIIEAVKSGKNTFVRIHTALPSSVEYRQVDRRLQALRRKGTLVYTGQKLAQGWKLPKEPQA